MGENYKPKRKRGEIMKSEVIGLRLESDILDEIREQARKNSRSIAKEITHQLKQKKERENENMEQLESYAEYCRQHITDNLEMLEGKKYSCSWDLANDLTQEGNANGSMTFSTYKAEQYIKTWFENVGVFLDEYKNEHGETPTHNPFNDQELFHCLMVIHGVSIILSQVDFLNDDKDIEITKENAERIKKEIEKFFPLFDYVENHEGK
jgi:hypothetical protein